MASAVTHVRSGRVTAPAKTVVVTHGLEAFARHWSALAPSSRHRFFVHPAWIAATVGAYFPAAKAATVVATVDGRPVGLLAFLARRMNRFGLFLPVHEVFCGGRGDHSPMLLAPDAPDDTLRTMLAEAARRSKSTGALRICHVPAEGGDADRVEAAIANLGLPVTVTRQRCRVLRLPSDPTHIDAVLPRKLKADIRRRRAKLEEELGTLAFRRLTSREEMRRALPALFAMHDRRWLESGKPGTFSEVAARRYYESLVDAFEPQAIHFTELTAGGRAIAYHFGMVSGGWLLHYKPTYDHSLSRFSPGKIHLRLLLDCAVEEGLTGLDFLQGGEEYKAEWAEETYETRTFTVRTRPFSAAYAWTTRGRPMVERAVWRTYNRVASAVERWRRR